MRSLRSFTVIYLALILSVIFVKSVSAASVTTTFSPAVEVPTEQPTNSLFSTLETTTNGAGGNESSTGPEGVEEPTNTETLVGKLRMEDSIDHEAEEGSLESEKQDSGEESERDEHKQEEQDQDSVEEKDESQDEDQKSKEGDNEQEEGVHDPDKDESHEDDNKTDNEDHDEEKEDHDDKKEKDEPEREDSDRENDDHEENDHDSKSEDHGNGKDNDEDEKDSNDSDKDDDDDDNNDGDDGDGDDGDGDDDNGDDDDGDGDDGDNDDGDNDDDDGDNGDNDDDDNGDNDDDDNDDGDNNDEDDKHDNDDDERSKKKHDIESAIYFHKQDLEERKKQKDHKETEEDSAIYFHRKEKEKKTKKKKSKKAHHKKHVRYPVITVDVHRVVTPFVIALWIFLACLGKIGFHMTPKLSKMFPESCMLIVLGVIIGLLLFYTHAATVSPLTADVFFIYMLPPIILDAGYFMPNRLFFDHLGTILIFAVIGTIWNALTIGISLYAANLSQLFGQEIPVLHMLLFSSLISAVDPVAVLAVFEEIHVEEVLFILVFGESLLNDGITVVLYHMFEGFSHLGQENLIMQDYFAAIASFLLVALGGTAIGIIWGFLTAFVTRFTKGVRVIEPVFIFVMSYLAYLNAEIFHLSGILSITFCGIAMKNYTTQNISQKSQTTVKYAMKMLAQSSETIIFMFLGVSTVHDDHDWNTAFVGLTILFCSLYRVIGTLILSTVCNTFRVNKIDFVQKFVISYGGLRGAVAFALVLTIDKKVIPAQPMFVTATIAVVYFTVFFQGITIKPLVEMLGVKKSKNRKLTMNERLHERSMDYLMAGVEDIMGKHGNYYIRDKFKRFNTKYLTPLLVRESQWSEPKLLETLQNIKMNEAMSNMQNTAQLESFAALYRTAQLAQMKQHHGGPNEGWNLDVDALEYNPTARDINEANFHHMLSDEYKPIKKRRQGTYKRHAVRDDEITDGSTTAPQLTHRNAVIKKHNTNHHRYHQKRFKEGANGKTAGGAPVQKLNGTAITLKHDYLDQQMRDNPAFQPDETDPGSYAGGLFTERPTRASLVQRKQSVDVDNGHTPTMAEMLLPWKREDEEDVGAEPRQAEHPYWANNEDYISTDSPSHTYLHKIGDPKKPSIHDIFKKRNSSASLYSIDEKGNGISDSRRSSSNNSSPKKEEGRRRSYKGGSDSRRSSLKDEGYWRSAVGENPRRGMTMKEGRDRSEPNSRRGSTKDLSTVESPVVAGSLLNTAITEEDPKNMSTTATPRKEHVINMEPIEKKKKDSESGDETQF